MPSLHLNSDGGGQNRKHKAARPLKPSLEPLPSPAATSNGNGMKNAPPSSRDGESAFCRALASGDPSTRLRALDALVAWLVAKGNSTAGSSVSRDDMRKLWKGMFYSYWHSDLAPVQKQLATRMAGIAGELHPELSALYLDAFYETLSREWAGIDRLRLDKFMLLVRFFVEVTFGLAAGTAKAASSSSFSSSAAVAASSSPWAVERVERLLRPLSAAMCPPPGAPLLSSSSGLGLHLADVAAGELLRAVAASSSSSSWSAPSTSSAAQVEGVLAAVLPFSRAAATTQRPELAARLSREFFSKVAAAIREGGGEGGGGGGGGEGGSKEKKKSSLPFLLSPSFAALLSKQLLSLASLPETRARNREVLYAAAAEIEAAGEEAKEEKEKDERKHKKEKKKPASRAEEVSPEREAEQQQREKQQQPKGKKRPAVAPEAAAPPTPPTAAPSKAAEQAAAAAAAAAAVAAAGGAAAGAPEAKKAKTATATAAAGALTPTPAQAPTAEQQQQAAEQEKEARKEKKRVRWSFKSNLAHAVGGPVPPPHVRTPPGSAPRGSALKVKGAGATTRAASAAAAAAAAAEAESGGNRRGGTRARADDFF